GASDPITVESGPFDPLSLPSLDVDTLHDFVSDLPLDFPDNYDLDISFDDLENLYFPDAAADQSILLPPDVSLQSFSSGSPDPDLPDSSDKRDGDVVLFVDEYLNASPSEEAGSCDSGGVLRSPVSSHGSGVASETAGCDAAAVDQNVVKSESAGEGDGEGNSSRAGSAPAKRKKESSEESRNQSKQKQRRGSESWDPPCTEEVSGEEEKRRARLMRNRESAQLSRQRKKHYVEELEEKVRAMHSTIADLNGKISFFMAENATLRQQLTAGCGPAPPPPPHGTMYPPMLGYPWVPCAPPYVVKPQGSQVPLVPIPRLKPQAPAASAGKAKKSESTKSHSKTKKVASVSFLGLLFFILLFGGLVPIVDVKFGGVWNNNESSGMGVFSNGSYDQHKGRVLIVDGVGASGGKVDVGNRIHSDRGRGRFSGSDTEKKAGSEHSPNASEPLVASLYVPRNDKLVKIDGNLIIHSVLASERGMASSETPEVRTSKETGLAIPGDLSQYLARGRQPHLHRTPTERRKALASGSADNLKDHFKSSARDGKMQQWFREGLAGPMLSSGMCSEVFQFDVSPAPGAIIPAASVANITEEHRHNATHINKGKNRRILRGVPIPLPGSDLNNITGERFEKSSQKDSFQGNKSVPPMIVSVLVDPREAGDVDVDSMITPKSLSRIFVVVLLDSIKYVTYSCVLPSSGIHL
ncbi:hypothetical protein Tsubulata_018234, partial [Turnera subulata]